MKSLTLWAGLLCLAACGSTDDDTDVGSGSDADTSDVDTSDADTGTDTDTEGPDADCPWELADIRSVHPTNNADNIWVSADFDVLSADISFLEGPVTAMVQTSAGTQVSGTSSVSGDVLTWTPTSGTLAGSTAHEFIVTSEGCSLVASTFTTIDPAPATFPVDAVYTLDFSQATGEAQFLTGLLFNDETSIALWQSSADRFEVVPMNDGEHEQCLSTVGALTTYDAPVLDLSDFTAAIGAPDSPVLMVQSDIRAVTDGGDGTAFANVHLNGFLDFSQVGDDFDFCAVLPSVGLACEPCPDFAANDCVPIQMSNITGAIDPNFVIVTEPDPFECGGFE